MKKLPELLQSRVLAQLERLPDFQTYSPLNELTSGASEKETQRVLAQFSTQLDWSAVGSIVVETAIKNRNRATAENLKKVESVIESEAFLYESAAATLTNDQKMLFNIAVEEVASRVPKVEPLQTCEDLFSEEELEN